ncbi:NUDIX domain-containing protein [Lacticaseibacillus daqingensis]|uniref:NUDIX domain-containing protein n=1 Tax=Lacticaseibacillus daqingensis TaxID=2486014 RepID=UPI000F78C46C|nr:NUDIX domain-containing protein [Lacticaseibacillus daqingensis]
MTKALTVVLVETLTGIILINRRKPPYRGLWNGLGGKVEPGEHPAAGARREVAEESGIQLAPGELTPAGLVHWHVDGALLGDLYLYTAQTERTLAGPQQTREGIIAPMPRDWLLAPDNLGLVPDLQPLLTPMLAGEAREYDSWFVGDRFDRLEVLGPWA